MGLFPRTKNALSRIVKLEAFDLFYACYNGLDMNERERQRLHDLATSFRDCSKQRRMEVCLEAVGKLSSYFQQQGISKGSFEKFVLFLARLGVSADRICGNAEYEFWKEVFDTALTPQEFFQATNGGSDPSFVAKMNGLIDGLSKQAKDDCCTLVMGFICSDGAVSEREFELLVSLFDD